MFRFITIVLSLSCCLALHAQPKGNPWISTQDLVWSSVSKDFSGSMPLGNGDIGLNVWAEKSGDVWFYIGKTDAFDQNATLLKLGAIRVNFMPSPFLRDSIFKQTLVTSEARIEINLGPRTKVSLWVDANRPIVHLTTQHLGSTTVELKTWRRQLTKMQDTQVSDMFKNLTGPDLYATFNTPDSILKLNNNRIGLLHHNAIYGDNPFEVNMRLQGLDEMADKANDPLRNRVFGLMALGQGFVKQNDTTLIATQHGKNDLAIYCLTQHPSNPKKWCESMDSIIDSYHKFSTAEAFKQHLAWWSRFWDRSYIHCSTSLAVEKDAVADLTRAYTLCRFMNAAAGRGKIPIKFNGSIFSYGKKGNPDYRRWGGPGFWYQNQRLIYWPMLAQGDFDLMMPWFQMYKDALPLEKFRTKRFFGHAGAFFPETITFWGTEVSSHYGWTPFEARRSPVAECTYLTYYFQNGIEQMLMMHDYVDYTNDTSFAKEFLTPHAWEVLQFYDKHYHLDNNGKMHLGPAQSFETWQVALNPLPEIAGLSYTLPKLLQLPKSILGNELVSLTPELLKHLPSLPYRSVNGTQILAPALVYDKLMNVENPELYAVFPYRIFGVGKPEKQLAINTFANRLYKDDVCWNQNVIDAALLGLVDTVRTLILDRAKPTRYSQSRFPAFWNMFNDWVPDVDHGGVLQIALQYMLMQCEGDQIRLLPTWPKEWDVEFKLYAPKNTIVECRYKNGKIEHLKVLPVSRQKDVILPE